MPPADLTVNTPDSATFQVKAGGMPAPSYQWRRDGLPIPGATGAERDPTLDHAGGIRGRALMWC